MRDRRIYQDPYSINDLSELVDGASLRFDGINLSDSFIVSIVKPFILANPYITTIDISACRIGDVGAAMLSSIEQIKIFKNLTGHKSGFASSALNETNPIKICNNLRKVGLVRDVPSLFSLGIFCIKEHNISYVKLEDIKVVEADMPSVESELPAEAKMNALDVKVEDINVVEAEMPSVESKLPTKPNKNALPADIIEKIMTEGRQIIKSKTMTKLTNRFLDEDKNDDDKPNRKRNREDEACDPGDRLNKPFRPDDGDDDDININHYLQNQLAASNRPKF